MKSITQLTKDIFEITADIEMHYPELYEFLNENPITIPSKKHSVMDSQLLADYLNSLQEILKHYLESEKSKDR
ncbi:hypothetical protein [Flavobacterium sp.]|uniref:hypothetical protein n=1 Tax=Flavobacterium sp. TaxID=239 RepID=UPI00326469D0